MTSKFVRHKNSLQLTLIGISLSKFCTLLFLLLLLLILLLLGLRLPDTRGKSFAITLNSYSVARVV